MMLILCFLIFSLFSLPLIDLVFAFEPIIITKSFTLDKVIFDGKWTVLNEWKESSKTVLINNGTESIQIRAAHQDDFLYILVNSLDDLSPNNKSDFSILCIDSYNEKHKLPDPNDYCIIVTLGANRPVVLQGGSISSPMSHFKNIMPMDGLIGIGNISDTNDRYQPKTPHPTYEFRIPIELVGRNNNYGFYIGVYDSATNSFSTYPQNLELKSVIDIPSPNQWGDLISPDNSLPEFHFMGIIFTATISIFVLQTKIFKNKLSYR